MFYITEGNNPIWLRCLAVDNNYNSEDFKNLTEDCCSYEVITWPNNNKKIKYYYIMPKMNNKEFFEKHKDIISIIDFSEFMNITILIS